MENASRVETIEENNIDFESIKSDLKPVIWIILFFRIDKGRAINSSNESMILFLLFIKIYYIKIANFLYNY